MNSRSKGKRGELEFAAFLRGHGFDARRGQQFAGGPDSPDIVSAALASWHVEVKRVERFNLAKACAQAARDGAGKPWFVAHRLNRGPWFITLDSDACYRLLHRNIPFFDFWPFMGPRPITMDAELFLQFLRRECEPRMDADKRGCGGPEHLTPSLSPQRGEGGSEITVSNAFSAAACAEANDSNTQPTAATHHETEKQQREL